MTPASLGFCMPGEFEVYEKCWVLWPFREDNWRDGAEPARHAFTRVIHAISYFARVCVGVNPDDLDRAHELITRCEGGRNDYIEIVELPSDDAWARDTSPIFVKNRQTGEVRGVNWNFNAYGGLYQPCDKDQMIATRILDMEGLGRFDHQLVLEGGAVHSDGQGTLLVTEETLLDPARNPGITRDEMEVALKSYLGAKTVIWLGLGVYGDTDTKGHVDNLACFIRPGIVALLWTDDMNDPQYARSIDAEERLRNAADAEGRQIEIVRVHQPTPMFIQENDISSLVQSTALRQVGVRLPASYINFLIVNGGVIVPSFNDSVYDKKACETLQNAFGAEYKVIMVPSRDILLGGGNVHCITCHQPV